MPLSGTAAQSLAQAASRHRARASGSPRPGGTALIAG